MSFGVLSRWGGVSVRCNIVLYCMFNSLVGFKSFIQLKVVVSYFIYQLLGLLFLFCFEFFITRILLFMRDYVFPIVLTSIFTKIMLFFSFYLDLMDRTICFISHFLHLYYNYIFSVVWQQNRIILPLLGSVFLFIWNQCSQNN